MNPVHLRIVRPLAVMLAGVVGATTVVAWPALPVGAAPRPEPFVRTVEPWDPAAVPETAPAFDLTAACVRPVAGGQFEAVFGYNHPGPTSVLVSLGADDSRKVGENVILRESSTGVQVEPLGPQVTLFKPGRESYAFAVRFEPHEQVAWQVRVPSQGGDDSGWKVTVRPRIDVRCRNNVPDHFAVVQHARIMVGGPVNVLREPPNHIVYYEFAIDVGEVRVACSAGGQVGDVQPVIGWQRGANLQPLKAPHYRVTITFIFGIRRFAMSTTTVRPVADVSKDLILMGPIADVAARCEFDDESVRSDEYWAELDGFVFVEPVLDEDQAVVDLNFGARSPVGSRLR